MIHIHRIPAQNLHDDDGAKAAIRRRAARRTRWGRSDARTELARLGYVY